MLVFMRDAALDVPTRLGCTNATILVILQLPALDLDTSEDCRCSFGCCIYEPGILTKSGTLLEMSYDEPKEPQHQPKKGDLSASLCKNIP